ncbi:DUF4185 domain-containing protein [Streptomyces sp. NA04227]|uniref:DUF4185 domain-containing protein n=1 Tax=Streptomyces sp. NA04227 TaxID=2742136 RepID=UPI001591776F|nr:DUF4185 domain-containing protein [Streptomyces sp. NA04227]QKW07966.1 DUF4185 domain-containing protein [Streptomyces sp. NA04227]
MSRARFLRTAAGVVVGGGAVLGGVGAMQASAGQDGSDAKDGAEAKGAAAGAGAKALNVTYVKDLTGPGITDRFGMAATDLGVPARTPDGRLLFVFGDTWEDVPFGRDWRAPVALYSETTDLAAGIEWSGAVGGDRAQQLWAYEHDNPEFSTVLPGDVITIGDTMYLHVAVQKPYPTVVWTEIWKSTDSGASWQHTGCRWGKPGTDDPGLSQHFQMVTWGQGNNGYVYCWSTRFDGNEPVIMHRVREDQITNPTAYEPWTESGWGRWGDPAKFVLTGKYRELCLRPIDGKWLFTGLGPGGIVAHVMDVPDGDPGPAHTLVQGVGWPENNPQAGRVAQVYGGYVIPGSTLNDLHLAVSQWENPDDQVPDSWSYHVMQFRVQGLAG